jgi:hypothetical protein
LYYAFLKKIVEADITDYEYKTEIMAYLFKGLIDKDKAVSQDISNYIEQIFQINDDINLTLKKVTR